MLGYNRENCVCLKLSQEEISRLRTDKLHGFILDPLYNDELYGISGREFIPLRLTLDNERSKGIAHAELEDGAVNVYLSENSRQNLETKDSGIGVILGFYGRHKGINITHLENEDIQLIKTTLETLVQ